MGKKRDLKSYSRKGKGNHCSKTFYQNIQQDMTSKLPKISYYQSIWKCFSKFGAQRKQWILATTDKKVEEELARAKVFKPVLGSNGNPSLIKCKKMSTFTIGEPLINSY